VPIYLVIAFCLISDPSICQDVRPDLADDFPMAGLAACQQMGERIAAEYVDAHPKWQLGRIKCRIGVAPREQDV